MLTKLPPIIRLTVFLLLSSGLHGGLAFYAWQGDPVDSHVTTAPVSVSFIPATKATQSVVKTEPSQVPTPDPPRPAVRPRLKPKIEPPTHKINKTLIKEPLKAEVLDKVVEGTPLTEMVCMAPREVIQEGASNEVVKNSPPAEPNVALASLVASDLPAAAEAASGDSPLVEAIPHYRSNPLPEYPRLARRKHWQGVVWLLVDVSPDGLVDDLQVEETCGHKVLDRAAERTVKSWQFSPATRGGLPVSSQVRIPVRFRLEDS
jgi:protein TonB